MKKFTDYVIAVACAAVAVTGVCAVAGCSTPQEKKKSGTGEAYALVHTADSVGYAKIVYTDGQITEAALAEVCLPTQVRAGEDVAEADKVTAVINNHGAPGEATYYKSVSFNGVTFTYDATAGSDGFSVGYTYNDRTLKDYLKTEANAKAYYQAVVDGNVTVKIGETESKDVMTKAKLYKDDNGYGGTNFDWKGNRDATVKYVKENGVSKLLKLTKNDDKVWTDGSVVLTGATWTDLLGANADNKASGSGAVTYAQLIVNADKNVK